MEEKMPGSGDTGTAPLPIRTARLWVLLAALSGCKLADPHQPNLDQVFELSASSLVLEADGVSRADVEVVLVGETPANATVKYSVDTGRFLEAPQSAAGAYDVTATAGHAHATYVAPTRIGTATVGATVSGLRRSITITLVRALPDSIRLTADRASAKADGNEAIVLSARLLRDEIRGSVSQGTSVRFVVLDASGNEVTNLAGEETVESTSGTVTHRLTSRIPGTFRVRAVILDSGRQIVSGDVVVTFT
jgi:hypothetical protein